MVEYQVTIRSKNKQGQERFSYTGLMDSRGDTLIKVWRLVNDKFAKLKPRRVTWPRVRRKRDAETNAPIRYTTRPYIKITAAVDDYLAREAEARSLDMSRLVQLIVLGKIRIRPTPAPSLRGRLNKTFRMTLTDIQKKAIIKMMHERQTKYPSLMTFALAAALGLEVINPDAPVLLTIQEELMLRPIDYARILATRYCSTPAVPLELDALMTPSASVSSNTDSSLKTLRKANS